MIGALGSLGDVDVDAALRAAGITPPSSGTWASTNPNTLGGSANRAAPGTITSGVNLAPVSMWSRVASSSVSLAPASQSVAGTYAPAAPSPALAVVKAVEPPPSEGLPREAVIVGAAVAGLAVIGGIFYALRRKR